MTNTTPFISFVHETTYDDEEQELVQDYGERFSFTIMPHGLLMNVENDGMDDDGNDKITYAGFVFTAEEAKTMLEFLKRHYGE